MPNKHRTRKRRQEPLPTQQLPLKLETHNSHTLKVFEEFLLQMRGPNKLQEEEDKDKDSFLCKAHLCCIPLALIWFKSGCWENAVCALTLCILHFPSSRNGFWVNHVHSAWCRDDSIMYGQFFSMQIVTIKKHQWGDEFILPWTGSKPFTFLVAIRC